MGNDSSLTLRGKSLFSDETVAVEFIWNPALTQPLIRWPGCPQGMPLAGLGRLSLRANRCTLVSPGKGPVNPTGVETLALTEHFMAAMILFSSAPIEVICHHGVFPLLDGSADPYLHALRKLGEPYGVVDEHPLECESSFSCRWEWENGYLQAEPSDRFQATYEISREDFESACALESSAQIHSLLAPARTFIFADDFLKIHSAGGLAGADWGMGLVLSGSAAESSRWRGFLAGSPVDNQEHGGKKVLATGLLHPGSYRFPNEPARHKMLDLVGDLALLGLQLPRLRLRLRNAGHLHHHRLLEALIHERAYS